MKLAKREYITILVDGEFKEKELWKVKEGSKTLWKVQAPKGILTFTRKKDAEAWIRATCK
jgi:hypothetical protein